MIKIPASYAPESVVVRPAVKLALVILRSAVASLSYIRTKSASSTVVAATCPVTEPAPKDPEPTDPERRSRVLILVVGIFISQY